MKNIRKIVMQHMISINILIFTIICCVFFALSVIIFLLYINQEQISTLEQIAERVHVIRNASTVTAKKIDEMFEYRLIHLSNEDKKIKKDLDKFFYSINDFYGEIGIPLSVTILMKDGFEYFSENEVNTDTQAIKTNYWYVNNFISKNENIWVQRFENEDDKKGNVLSYGKILRYGENNDYQGIILVSSTENQFYELYENLIEKNSNVYILDKDGYVISHTNKNLINVQLWHMKAFFENYNKNQINLANKNGELILKAIYYHEDSQLTLVREVTIYNFFEEYIVAFIVAIFSILASVIIIVFIATRSISKKISTPIETFRNNLIVASNEKFRKINPKEYNCAEIYELSLVYNDMTKKIEQHINDTKEHERAKRIHELDVLQLQIKPHFLHNTLFAIKCLLELGYYDKVKIMMDNFMQILKVPIKTKNDSITLFEELNLTKAYFELMKIKHGKEMELYYDLDENTKEFLVPRFILQPIIENSILHGADDKLNSPISVDIFAYKEDEYVIINVNDTGIGMTEEQLKSIWKEKLAEETKYNSIGLKNIKERILLTYGDKSEIIIESNLYEGTKITLKLYSGKEN